MHTWQARDAVCEIGRRLWQRGYVAANDGNLSVRIDDDRFLFTPTGVSKGFMQPDGLLVADSRGRVIQGDGKPSSEILMHLEVYRLRPEIGAVVHAHPPVATAFSVAGIPLDKCVLPESVVILGAVPVVPYATPWTEEIPRGLRPVIPGCDAVLLENHGAVTWAGELEAAYFKMETLEMTATITHHALSLGNLKILSAPDVAKLMRLREEKQLPGRLVPCKTGESCAVTSCEQDELVDRITRAVVEALEKSRR